MALSYTRNNTIQRPTSIWPMPYVKKALLYLTKYVSLYTSPEVAVSVLLQLPDSLEIYYPRACFTLSPKY